ncbi:MAG: hypothetical protein R2695_17790 [Acidimicrobiales bacterium]
MTDLPMSRRSLPSQMGARLRRLPPDTIECWVDVTPELCSHGLVRGSVLVMLVDVGAGWAAEQCSEGDWTFTVDIGLRRAPVATERISGVPAVQRAGRTVSVDLGLRDETGVATAHGVSTFIRLPRRPDDRPRVDVPTDLMAFGEPPYAPLAEQLAATPTDLGLQVELRPELLNPARILQGGVASLLAELAAQERMERLTGEALVVTSFDVRYITMGRVGPIEAVVEPLGDRAAVVKLIDRGANDAVVTHNLLGFSPV